MRLADKIIQKPWLLAALVIAAKLIMFGLFCQSGSDRFYGNTPFYDCADRSELLVPVDNFITYGYYSMVPEGEPYAGRLPGFVFPYMVFRSVSGEVTANVLLGVFIFLMSVYASVRLVQLLRALGANPLIALAGLMAACIVSYWWHWDFTLHPNSLAVSCLIIGSWHMYRFFSGAGKVHLLGGGFYFAWMFMLRGFAFLYLPFAAITVAWVLAARRTQVRSVVSALLLLATPFLLMEAAWVTRNFMTFGRFIPLQTSFVPGADNRNDEYGYASPTKYSMMKVRELINCWGGDNFWYFRNSDLNWFFDTTDARHAADRFSSSIFNGPFHAASLDSLKTDVSHSMHHRMSLQEREDTESRIAETALRLKGDFMKGSAWYFYLVAPFNRLSNMWLRNPTQDWPGPSFTDGGYVRKAVKLLSVAIFAAVITAFLIATGYFLIRREKNPVLYFLMAGAWGIIGVFMFIINATHYTYFITGYVPASIVVAVWTSRLTGQIRLPR